MEEKFENTKNNTEETSSIVNSEEQSDKTEDLDIYNCEYDNWSPE